MTNLGAVGKVAELGLPEDKGVGVLKGVAQLKSQDAELAQAAVGDGELPWFLRGATDVI